VRTFLKCVMKQLPMSCLSEDQIPEGSFRKSIAFLILLIIVDVWKNFVFTNEILPEGKDHPMIFEAKLLDQERNQKEEIAI
jgi:hypothetical protein